MCRVLLLLALVAVPLLGCAPKAEDQARPTIRLFALTADPLEGGTRIETDLLPENSELLSDLPYVGAEPLLEFQTILSVTRSTLEVTAVDVTDQPVHVYPTLSIALSDEHAESIESLLVGSSAEILVMRDSEPIAAGLLTSVSLENTIRIAIEDENKLDRLEKLLQKMKAEQSSR